MRLSCQRDETMEIVFSVERSSGGWTEDVMSLPGLPGRILTTLTGART